jgi:putative two-component system response regulator
MYRTYKVYLGRIDDEQRHVREMADLHLATIEALALAIDAKDQVTHGHIRRVQQFALRLAKALGVSDEATLRAIEAAGLLHDIGKLAIPDHILNKPGPLTPEEYVEMQKHPSLGRDVILKAEQQVGVRDDATLAMAKDIVYTHHERWDGSGYPRGLKESEIPVPGRIMAVVDVYDAAVSRNLYRRSMPHGQAVELICRGKGTHFDPAVVDAFLGVAERFEEISREAESR